MSAEHVDEAIKIKVVQDVVAIVTIDNQKKRNAISLSMCRALGSAFDDLSARADVKAVVLRGEGGHFCAGADISEFSANRSDAMAGQIYDEVSDEALQSIRTCSKPVVAAVSGVAVGGGLGLALACDFRLASSDIRMGITAARLGLVYSIDETRLLFEKVGLTNAKEILFTGDIFTGKDCERLSLVDRFCGEDVDAQAIEFAASMANGAPLSIRGAKAILNSLAEGSQDSAKSLLKAHIVAAFDSHDYVEGRAAFSERRKPVFRGL